MKIFTSLTTSDASKQGKFHKEVKNPLKTKQDNKQEVFLKRHEIEEDSADTMSKPLSCQQGYELLAKEISFSWIVKLLFRDGRNVSSLKRPQTSNLITICIKKG